MAIRSSLLVALLTVFSASPTYAVVVYSEVDDGELNFDNVDPTPLGIFMPGVNSVTGSVANIGFPEDFFPDPFDPENTDHLMGMTADIFTFTVAPGTQLDSVSLGAFSGSSPVANMFMALDDGPIFDVNPYDLNFGLGLNEFIGGALVGNPLFGVGVGDELLPVLANSAVAGSGFDVPLATGQYTVYLQEQSSSPSEYTLLFRVSDISAVPEASSTMLLGACGVGFFVIRRRRKRSRRLAIK